MQVMLVRAIEMVTMHQPILKPNLYRAFSHVDILRNTFSNSSSRCRVFVELDFQSAELILCCPLPLLILLLLCKGALPRWSTRARIIHRRRQRRRGRRGGHDVEGAGGLHLDGDSGTAQV